VSNDLAERNSWARVEGEQSSFTGFEYSTSMDGWLVAWRSPPGLLSAGILCRDTADNLDKTAGPGCAPGRVSTQVWFSVGGCGTGNEFGFLYLPAIFRAEARGDEWAIDCQFDSTIAKNCSIFFPSLRNTPEKHCGESGTLDHHA
jgi:hypothetical protein